MYPSTCLLRHSLVEVEVRGVNRSRARQECDSGDLFRKSLCSRQCVSAARRCSKYTEAFDPERVTDRSYILRDHGRRATDLGIGKAVARAVERDEPEPAIRLGMWIEEQARCGRAVVIHDRETLAIAQLDHRDMAAIHRVDEIDGGARDHLRQGNARHDEPGERTASGGGSAA